VHYDHLWSSKVDDFSTNLKRVYDILFDLSISLGPIFPRFRDIIAFVRRNPLFPHLPLFRRKFLGLSRWSKSVTFGLQRANTQAN